MKMLSRNRVRNLVVELTEWNRHVDHLAMTHTGPGMALIPNLSERHPETIAAARELFNDLHERDIEAPRLREWLDDPNDWITNDLMRELGRIAMDLPPLNGLTFREVVGRKSPELRDVIVAVRDAIPYVQGRYERDEELPILFDTLLDPQLKTVHGITISETLRKIEDVLSREAFNRRPAVPDEIQRAIDLIRPTIGRYVTRP